MPEVAKQYLYYLVPLFKKECHLNCFSYVNSGAKKINAKNRLDLFVQIGLVLVVASGLIHLSHASNSKRSCNRFSIDKTRPE